MSDQANGAGICPAGDMPPCQVILDMLPAGLVMVDVGGKVRIWNRAMEQMTGYRAQDVLGRPCSLLACDTCATSGASASPFRCHLLVEPPDGNGGPVTVDGLECTVRAKDGELVPVLKNARGLTDDQDVPAGIIETLTDLRPLKRLERDLADIRESTGRSSGIGRLIGSSTAMRDVYERVRLAADSDATVLILGETGTGKELVAEAIHTTGARRDAPFVKVNCSALPESLLESELFGHVRGAFTGATGDKVGRFEAADTGTIFLDEIGDVSPLIQLKLLRVLQEKEFERVGESTPRKVNVRVICATNRDLRELVRQGEFREDLYYRIRVFPIDLPPLRQRMADIPTLVRTFIERFNMQTGKHISGLTSDVLHCLMDHCWPGNVRELENAIEHAFVTCQTDEIGLFDLPTEIRMVELRAASCRERRFSGIEGVPEPVQASSAKIPEQLQSVLEECGWNRSEAARRLGVDRTTVWRRMKQWGIEDPVG